MKRSARERGFAAVIMLGVIFSSMAWSASAMAQSDQGSDLPTEFVNMEEYLVDGQVKKAAVSRHSALDRAKFKPLRLVKRSLLPELKETASDAALD